MKEQGEGKSGLKEENVKEQGKSGLKEENVKERVREKVVLKRWKCEWNRLGENGLKEENVEEEVRRKVVLKCEGTGGVGGGERVRKENVKEHMGGLKKEMQTEQVRSKETLCFMTSGD